MGGLISYVGNADGGSVGNDVIITVIPATLSVELDSLGNLVIKDITNNGRANNLTLSADGTNLSISDTNESFRNTTLGTFSNGHKALTIPLVNFSGNIIIDAGLKDDKITINGANIGAKSLKIENTETLSIEGLLTTTGTVSIEKGTMTLTAANQIANTADVYVATGAILDLAGFSDTVDGLSGDGTVTNSAVGVPVTLTLGANNQTATFTGIIENGSGTVSLIKTGSGTQTLSATNTYTGTTTVNGGRLVVVGSITSAVSVNANGTLGGSGTITGNVSNSGTVAPGASPGTINVVGNFTSTGTLASEFTKPITTATAGSNYDQVNITGGVSLGGTLNLSFSGTGSIADREVFTLVNNDGSDAVTGQFTNYPTNGMTFTADGHAWVIFYDGGTGNDVTLTTVPSLVPSVVYVNDDWTNEINGSVNFSSQFGDEVMGYNAFTDLASALSKVEWAVR
jgi:autotransporter-associated beta strand protein